MKIQLIKIIDYPIEKWIEFVHNKIEPFIYSKKFDIGLIYGKMIILMSILFIEIKILMII